MVQNNLNSMASYINLFKKENGRYPNYLTELPKDTQVQYNLSQILNDRYQDYYDYRVETNGYTILVTMPKSFFLKWKLEIFQDLSK